ncbi:hypothetical protein C8R41DRAFT_818248 [Lentinula lateritia]|uniref:DUF7330 domain-containing protein n=1 Tax=Lentinula lateritia TaxID=40482 RepID=A0ABQ8VTG9_9AGAR|nr:hypothetical protein C8R41DRAFT_818248 [Lentinula lateritia]
MCSYHVSFSPESLLSTSVRILQVMPPTGWPSLNGFTIDHDATWSSAVPSSSQHSYVVKEAIFRFPTSADRLFCLSRGSGPLAGGTFHLTQSDRLELANRIEIKIIVEYWTGNVHTLDSILKVCELRRMENQYGIGILTRPPPGFEMSYQFYANIKVVVTLPRPQLAAILQLKNFETDLPMYSHLIDNLASTVYFRTISLRGCNTPIRVESIGTGKATFETSNAPIEGLFATTTSLKIVTSNSHIRASVFLQSNDATSFSELTMRSSNGPINASIILGAPTSTIPERGGNFSINASTQLGPLSLIFPSAPPSCNLHLQGSTSLGPADITLPKTYEGAFKVQTSLGLAFAGFGNRMERVERVENVHGAHRRLLFEQDGAVEKKGWLCSSDEGRWRGEVKIMTSMAPVTLRF